MVLAFCAPAQGSPADVQYVGEAPGTIAGNAGRGTDAVNDALAETDDPAGGEAVGSGTPGDAPTEGSEAGEVEQAEGPASLTELPETGGIPPALAGAGLLLVTVLIARRITS